jgi:predicted nuclease of predicted toxin-antitoxin system
MKLLVDMNLSSRWVDFFMDHGISAVHWSNLGAANAPDVEIFAYAQRHGLILFTHDLDFSAILAHRASCKPSVIQIRHPTPYPGEFGAVLASALEENSAALNAGALLVIEPHRHRIRILPILPETNT